MTHLKGRSQRTYGHDREDLLLHQLLIRWHFCKEGKNISCIVYMFLLARKKLENLWHDKEDLCGKHERGSRGAAPASNVATCEGCCCLVRPPSSFFFFFHNSCLRDSDSGRFALIHTKSDWFTPTRAVSGETSEAADLGRNSKKKKEKEKKGAKRTISTQALNRKL